MTITTISDFDMGNIKQRLHARQAIYQKYYLPELSSQMPDVILTGKLSLIGDDYRNFMARHYILVFETGYFLDWDQGTVDKHYIRDTKVSLKNTG